MGSSTLHLLAVCSLIIWSSTFALHIEPSETFVNDVARSITRPPNATGQIIPKDHQDSELKDVAQTVKRLPNDAGHILPKDQQDSELMNARNTRCGTTFTLSAGDTQTIKSKNDPRRYPNNHKCTWEIETDSAATVLIFTCKKFKMKWSKSCKKDYLQLQNGDKINTKFCGRRAPRSVISNTGSLTVSFKTDWNKKAKKGFKCTVTAVGTTASTTTTTSSSTTTTTSTSTTPTTSSFTTTTPTSTTTTTTTTTVPTGEKQCTCGKVNRGSRIVGGLQTEVNEYPWQVGMLGSSSAPYCGASIIADQWVLTAAHCVDGKSPGAIRLVVGEHDHTVTGETDATKQLTITQVIVHPSYSSRTFDNDIALLKLSEPLEFMSDNKVAPVCLPEAAASYDNANAIVTGWGTLTQGGSQPDQLYEVTVPIMTNAECRDTQYGNQTITDNMICAGLAIGGGKDSCQGDSGGPMVTQGSTNSMVQIGVVSWGNGCAKPGYPGVYTRVTQYLDWIASKTANSQTCLPATS